MGAILGLRLALSIARVLKFDRNQLTFWSDSIKVLWWIQGRSRSFKPFVANRIGEIHDSNNPSQLHYVSTRENPADLLTRGAAVAELKPGEMWWRGPTFLSKDQETWPKTETDPSAEVTMEVGKKMKTSGEPVQESTLFALMPETPSPLQPSRFSSWRKLVRVRAWVGRFVNNCRIHINERSYGKLGCQEIAHAEIEIIKKAQQEAFHEDYKALVEQKALSSY